MPRNRDQLLWAAARIHRQLVTFSVESSSACRIDNAVAQLAERQQTLARVGQQLATAHARGWHLAAGLLTTRLFVEAHRIESGVAQLLACQHQRSLPPPPSTLAIVAELRQLEQEFDSVEVRGKERVVVVTTVAVILDDVHLGPFAIELHLDRLRDRPNLTCFACVALEPNPAAPAEDVTHPHVRGRALCGGDATVPIAAALREGRVADAFLLIRSVLQTYNPASAYVLLEEWDGVACEDCGRTVDRERLYYCDGCNRDFCDNCTGCCDVCDQPRCRGCLELDEVSDSECCESCRQTCDACGRTVDADHYHPDSGLCPSCLQKQQAADEAGENQEDQNDPHDNRSDSPTTDKPLAAAPQDAAPAAA